MDEKSITESHILTYILVDYYASCTEKFWKRQLKIIEVYFRFIFILEGSASPFFNFSITEVAWQT